MSERPTKSMKDLYREEILEEVRKEMRDAIASKLRKVADQLKLAIASDNNALIAMCVGQRELLEELQKIL